MLSHVPIYRVCLKHFAGNGEIYYIPREFISAILTLYVTGHCELTKDECSQSACLENPPDMASKRSLCHLQ
jgi:hypothetical protein